MKVKDYLEKNGFHAFEHVDEKFNELKEQFIEMSQIKSDFDIEKFTVRKEGDFIAHNFHFLMRQYSLTLGELRRMLIDKEEKERMLDECNILLKKGIKKTKINGEGRVRYVDLYMKEIVNQLDMIDINIANKAMRIKTYEAARLKLIEMNGGQAPTNEEYQAEEPQYWAWFLKRKALEQYKQARTGISEGVWMNIQYLEEPPLLTEEYQVKMLDDNGFLNLDNAKKEIDKRLLKCNDIEEIHLLKE